MHVTGSQSTVFVSWFGVSILEKQSNIKEYTIRGFKS